MGIEYSAVIAVGLLSQDFPDQGKLEDWIENDELQDFSPMYDGYGEGVAGLLYKESDDYSPTAFEWNQLVVDKLKKKFKSLTGLDGKVWLSPHGT